MKNTGRCITELFIVTVNGKTDINETEYLKGFSVNEIYDYENSFNTKIKYRNYFLKFLIEK